MEKQLTESQTECKDSIVDFYKAPGENFFVLEGFAGVGKTFTIVRAIKELQAAYPTIKISVTAPTNKAVKVLLDMAREYELDGVLFFTIYKSLGFVLTANDEEKRVARMAEGNFEDMHLVIVDEASMLSRHMTETLKDAAIANNTKVVLMGDSYQLPPVKEKSSPAFELADREYRLSKPMRNEEGNPILELVRDLRADIEHGTANTEFRSAFNPLLDCGIYLMDGADWMVSVRENFASPEYQEDPDLFRVLAWTNKRVNAMNRTIRKLLVGETVSPFVVGERTIARQPILRGGVFQERPEVIINTDEESEVISIYESWHPDFEGMKEQFKVWVTLLKAPSGDTVETYILHEDSQNDYRRMVNKLVDTAKKDGSQWRHFWQFKDSFADLQPPHALTVHRSQGSSFKNVFLDVKDCAKNRDKVERNKLLYVGASRASDNLLILRG